MAHSTSAPKPNLVQIGWAFVRLGAIAFGGLGATLSLIQREFADRHRWITVKDVSEALAFTKPLPGSTVVQIVTFLGWRMRHWPGALIATTAFLLPSVVLMITAAALVATLPKESPLVEGGLTGLQVAVVGLLAAAMWRLARSEASSVFLTPVLLAAFVGGLYVNAALVVAVAGAIGVLVERGARRV